jgi:uncharacterized protein YbbK (DUF523 family)
MNPTDSGIRLGVSACLLGQPVRYDGGHKRDRWITDVLGPQVDFVPVCPEVECGLPVPREPMRLVGDPAAPRLVTIRTGVDHTERLLGWARRRVAALKREGLCGFLFKAKSPSCGLAHVRVYRGKGVLSRAGVGLFARSLMERFPLLPVEEADRLNDAALRENFVERLFTVHRWHQLVAAGRTRGNLARFHAEHKVLLMAHSPKHADALGRLVAQAKGIPTPELFGQYLAQLMGALRKKVRVKVKGEGGEKQGGGK